MKRCLPILLLLAACAGTPPPPAAPAAALAAPVAGAYRIDTAQSLITVTVRRGGPLARLGHDHVVASRSISGYVDLDAGLARFQFPLDQMTVDEPALRRQAGLDTTPSADAIEATRNNMLTRLLDARRYPLVQLAAVHKAHGVALEVTLHGVTRSVDVPVRMVNRHGALTVSGSLRLLQSDFGIEPMSILGGALVVKDEMELAFTIVARQ